MKNTLIYIVIILLMASCDKREFYIPMTENGQIIEHPGQVITIVTSTQVEKAQVIFYSPGKPEINTITGTPIDIEAGNYQVVIVTNNELLTMNGTVASLPITEDGETIQAPMFYAGVGNITVKEGEINNLSIPVHPMTREVQFQFSIRGVSILDVQKVEVSLYGILASCNLNEGFIISNTPRNIAGPYFIRTFPELKENTYLTKIRLLGIDSTQKQEIVTQIMLNNGTTYTFNEDVSKHLSDFNEGYADIALVMEAQIILDIDEITGSIKPWQPGIEDDIPME